MSNERSAAHSWDRVAVRSWLGAIGVAAIVILLDQVTKSWAVHRLHEDVFHVMGSLEFALTYNRGVAFGLGQGVAPLLIVVAIAGLILTMVGRRVQLTSLSIIGIGMVFGGACSNVSDRLFRHTNGAVVDFIDLRWWPVFNIADASIVIGALLLVIWGSRPRGDSESS